ncbi:LysR family transcriptional regulator [Shinella sp.]|uniref:LysR family transcriptional regulator n=1 Tax=Shinella sp. TaxID=1870904 RepID=UPI0039C9615A
MGVECTLFASAFCIRNVNRPVWIFRFPSECGMGQSSLTWINVSQSTISKRVQEGEALLSCKIFERSTRNFILTPEGRSIIGHIERILDLYEEIKHTLRKPGHFAGRFRFGTTEMVAISWLPQLVSAIRLAYPDVILEPVIDNAWNLFHGLRECTLDPFEGGKVNDMLMAMMRTNSRLPVDSEGDTHPTHADQWLGHSAPRCPIRRSRSLRAISAGPNCGSLLSA